jgi:hypothetical protein
MYFTKFILTSILVNFLKFNVTTDYVSLPKILLLNLLLIIVMGNIILICLYLI